KGEKLLVEASYDEMTSNWDGAARLYRSLWDSSLRQQPEYAYREANAQIRAGKAKESLDTISELRQQPGEMRDSPTIDLREAEAFAAMEKWSQSGDSAENSARKAHSMGAKLLEAEALWRLCDAQASLGRAEKARTACQQASDIATPLG